MTKSPNLLRYRPKTLSVVLTVVFGAGAYLGQQLSPMIGYFLALLTMIAIVVASLTDSFWPSKETPENPIVFGLFWGLMLGLLLPYVLIKYWPA